MPYTAASNITVSPIPQLPIKILHYCPHVKLACVLHTPLQYMYTVAHRGVGLHCA